MKILHVTKKYPNAIGGDAIVVSNLEKQQKRQGHEVFILTSNCKDILDKNNIIRFGNRITTPEIDKINLKRIISLIKLKKEGYNILREIKPDVIHSHSSDLGYAISFAAHKYNIPIINTCHGTTFNDNQYNIIKRKLELYLLKNSKYNRIITVDPTSLKDFEKYGLKNAIYLPNGIDLENFKNKIRKVGKIKNVLFVGRLEKQKGLDCLIEAINIIKKEEIKINIIGDGSEKDYLIDKIKSLEIQYKFNFLGKKNQKDILEYYKKSDLFILPSLWEGFPLTLLEAWASSLPVIVTNVGANKIICKNKENSMLIKSKDSKALSKAILEIINMPKLAEKIGENGRRLVEKDYSWKKISKDVEKVYLEVNI